MLDLLGQPFQRTAFTELATAEPGSGLLLVMARGLGVDLVFRQLLVHLAHPSGLVVALGVPDGLIELVSDDFSVPLHAGSIETDVREDLLRAAPLQILDSERAPLKRQEAYLAGGIVCTSPRILLLDLLQERLAPDLISYLLLYDVHRAAEHGMEAFCADLIGKANRQCRIFAFSDGAEALLSGHVSSLQSHGQTSRAGTAAAAGTVSGGSSFGHFERILRGLRIGRVLFFPRFRSEVSADLDRAGTTNVIEAGVRLGREARAAQVLLLDLLAATVRHLLSLNTFLDSTDFPPDLALSPAFEMRLQASLDASWHQLTPATSQALEEVRTVRRLINSNVSCPDRQAFRESVEAAFQTATLLPPDRIPAWLALDSAELLVRTVRELDPEAGRAKVNPKLRQIQALLDDPERPLAGPVVIVTESEQSLLILNEFFDGPGAAEIASAHPPKPEPEPKRRRRNGTARVILADPYGHWLGASAPGTVLIYDLTMLLIRQLEVYRTTLRGTSGPLIYYFMFIESTEEQRYLTGVRRERDAFERLIRTHANLPRQADIAVERNDDSGDAENGGDEQAKNYSSLLEEFGAELEDSCKDVIVDVRELRSALPFILHQRSFRLLPLTLTTADYIVADGVGVERKTVSDLIGSLNTGRLLAQSERLCAEFSCAVLLIELDSPRGLRTLALGSNLSVADVQAKLCLLLLHRPRLRLIWSTGPHATADYFSDLRRRRKPPTRSADTGPDGNEDRVNGEARSVLLGMRGVIDERNVGLVMRSFSSLRELLGAPRARLEEVLGQALGKRLFDFFHTPPAGKHYC